MSFLNTVLSSIGSVEQGRAPTSSISQPGLHPPSNGLSASSSRPSTSAPPPPLKRKAEPLASPSPAKLPRINSPISRPPAPVLPSHPKPNVNRIMTPPAAAVGRSAPQSSSALKATNLAADRPTLNSIDPSANVKTAARQTTTKIPTTSATTSGPPPKKGSYREIMARAQAAKAAQADFGQIKHKPVPKLSRKERLAQETEAAEKAKQEARHGKSAKRDGRPGLSIRDPGKSVEDLREKKKPVDLGYKGTMRPAPTESAYKGTIKNSSSVQQGGRIPSKSVPKGPPDRSESGGRYRYASYSDEEDEEDEEDYDDESDMEAAGFDELEEEEQQSLRVAKKEDDEALKEENKHKREKAERKRKLEELAARSKRR